jgi:hypothetical protein
MYQIALNYLISAYTYAIDVDLRMDAWEQQGNYGNVDIRLPKLDCDGCHGMTGVCHRNEMPTNVGIGNLVRTEAVLNFCASHR